MRILYFLNLDRYSTNIGIIQKSFTKKAQWIDNQHEVKLIIIHNEESDKHLINQYGECSFIQRQSQSLSGQFRIMRLLDLWPSHEKAMFREIDNFSPDIVYHRTFEMSEFIARICKNNTTIIELNGNEIGNLFAYKSNLLQAFVKKIKATKIKLSLKKFLGLHKGLVFVTYELLELYKRQSGDRTIDDKSIVIPNGIDIRSYNERKKGQNGSVIKLVFIGTPGSAWHGIDIIIALAKKTIGILEYHLIGQKFNKADALPSNIKAYGYLSQSDYRKIISGCDIGIGTLALNTAGINEASPLKVREYVAAGLPIIIGYKDTAFEKQPLPKWVLQLPNDSNTIISSVDKIVDFCKNYKDFIVPKSEAEFYFSSERLEKKRLSFFQKIMRSSFSNTELKENSDTDL